MSTYILKRSRNFYRIPERKYEELSKKIMENIKTLSENKILTESEVKDIADTLIDMNILLGIRERIIKEQKKEFEKNFAIHDKNKGLFMGQPYSPESNIEENDGNNSQEDCSQEACSQENSDQEDSTSENSPKKKTGKKLKRKVSNHNNYAFKETPICPCCKNKMHKTKSKNRTVMFAQPVMKVETSTIEAYRCLNCNTKAIAPYPEEIDNTIGKYHYSMVASLATSRYLTGMPSKRFEGYSENQGYKVSASTAWDLFESGANIVRPFYKKMEIYASNYTKTIATR
jgi:hypothetical protein